MTKIEVDFKNSVFNLSENIYFIDKCAIRRVMKRNHSYVKCHCTTRPLSWLLLLGAGRRPSRGFASVFTRPRMGPSLGFVTDVFFVVEVFHEGGLGCKAETIMVCSRLHHMRFFRYDLSCKLSGKVVSREQRMQSRWQSEISLQGLVDDLKQTRELNSDMERNTY